MKKHIKPVCSCIAVILIFAVIAGLFSNIVKRKASYTKYADFFDQEENFDVLFFGNSHMWNAVFPMDLWNAYGIVSYNFGGPGNQMAINYWNMMNALDYTTPQLVVVDCCSIRSNSKIPLSKEHVHQSLDALPLSKTKIAAVKDLFEDTKERWEFIWNYSIYHNRWIELSDGDFLYAAECEKGAQSKIGVAAPDSYESISDDQVLSEDTLSMKYLDMIIAECKKRNIEVLLTYLPFPADEPYQKEANTVRDLAEKYGVSYINFLDTDIVNYDTDMYDPNSHLNPSGAQKVTAYLGEYITNHYNIADQRDNDAYAYWNDDYMEYQDYKIELMQGAENLSEYLMMLCDPAFSCVIEIKDKKKILGASQTRALLENMNINCDKMESDSENVIFVQDGGKSISYYNSYEDIEESALKEYDYSQKDRKYAVRILLIDNRDGMVADDMCADRRGNIISD